MKWRLCTCVAALVGSATLGPPASAQQGPSSSASEPRNDAHGPPAGVGRDPFVRPSAEADEMPVQSAPSPVPPPEGLAGLSDEQITMRGVVTVNGRHVALVQGPDRKHYVIRPGDRLRNGIVQSVVPGGLVMVPDITGPVGGGTGRRPGHPPRLPGGEGQ